MLSEMEGTGHFCHVASRMSERTGTVHKVHDVEKDRTNQGGCDGTVHQIHDSSGQRH